MQREKRPLLLTGLIISVVSFSLFFLIFLVFLVELLNSGNGFYFYYFYANRDFFLILTIIFTILLGIGIVFSGIGLSICMKPFPVYKRKHGYILTTFIIMCLFVLLELIELFSGMVSPLFILLFIMNITGAVFTLIGYIKAFSSSESEEFVPSNKVAGSENNFDNIYNKIEKILKLREMNVLTETEFQELKQKFIDEMKQ